MELRPYQQESIDALFAYFERKDGNPLLVLPTGAGKSVVQAAFVERVLSTWPGQRFLLLTHVKELVEQNASKLERFLGPLAVGVYSAGLNRRELDRPVTVASVQSLARRLDDLPRADLVIIDEAHLVPPAGEGQYRTLLESLRALNPAVKVIGMSATPYRLKSGYLHTGEGRIFTDIAHEVGVRELIDAGYLAPLVSCSGASQADLSGVHVRGGEYVADELADVMMADGLVERSLDEVEQHCGNRRSWLVFCSTVAHAQAVRSALDERGYTPGFLTGATPQAERDELIRRFRDGSLSVLVNVNVLTTGFDAPNVDAVILMRATRSAGLYYQMVGRGLRIAPGKADCMVLDFGGNVMRHGPIDAIEIRDRKRQPGGGEAPWKACPECRKVTHASARRCECGYEYPIESKPPHETSASSLPVLSQDVEIEVTETLYARHTKPGKPPSLRVDYWCGMTSYSDWVCLEHDGFARQKAMQWWAQRGQMPVPDTIDEALERVDELAHPVRIKVRRDGRFWRVVSTTLREAA